MQPTITLCYVVWWCRFDLILDSIRFDSVSEGCTKLNLSFKLFSLAFSIVLLLAWNVAASVALAVLSTVSNDALLIVGCFLLLGCLLLLGALPIIFLKLIKNSIARASELI